MMEQSAPATPPTRTEPQSAAAVFMVRPASFAFNPETAASNAFQVDPGASGVVSGARQVPAREAQAFALHEFDGLAGALQRAGVEVLVVEDGPVPPKPDALFPNNWLSMHRDGTVVLYPMLAPNRRLERRADVLSRLAGASGYRIDSTLDLTPWEAQGQFLEGTGSLVLDRVNRIAYAARSPRTAVGVVREFGRRMGYEPLVFDALDAAQPVYHTNVLMAVGATFAVLCSETLTDMRQRGAVLDRLRDTGHAVLEISRSQMHRFAGNLLELAPAAGNVIALSSNAWDSFDAAQRRLLEAHGSVLAVDIPTIERLGGGGVRCMLAEIHLPQRRTTLMS